jgi:predicted PurR-regulated permease PerM
MTTPLETPRQRARAASSMTRTPPFLIGLVGGFGVLAAYYLGKTLTGVTDILILITIALVLAAGLNPFVEMLTVRGFGRRWAVAIVALGTVALFAGFIAIIAQPLADQTKHLLNNDIPTGLKNLEKNPTIVRLDKKYHFISKLQTWLANPDTAKSLAGGVLGFGKFLIGSVFKTFTVLMLTVYFLGSLPAMMSGAQKLVPRSRRERAASLMEEVLARVGGYVSGAIIVATLATFASWVMLSALSVGYALPLALLVGVTDLVPIVGATFGAFVVSAVVLLDSPTKAIITLLFLIAYQQVENYLIYPRVMSRSVEVPPAVALIAALGGAALFGVIGALLAIPLAAGLLVVVRRVVLPAQDRAPSPPDLSVATTELDL